MIETRANQLSIVVQGEVGPATELALSSYRTSAPEAQLILSTYEHCAQTVRTLQSRGFVDVLVINADPGALPPTVKSPTAGANNLNRMLVSTQAGLARADRELVLKVRSDAQIDPVRAMQRWSTEGDDQRLLFASRYTRHPFGINAYLFHVSDWITFGRLDKCRQYWAAPLMDPADATHFEHEPMPDRATATARRFRARLTQEQWICTHYAKSIGYDVPSRLAQRDPQLVQQYIDFLANECIVCDRESIGLSLAKHERAFHSLFQRIDCLSESEWQAFQFDSVSRKKSTAGMRFPTFAMRGVIARMFLLGKRLFS